MMQKHKRRALRLMTLGAFVLVVSLSLMLQGRTVTAREMLHPCPDAGEDYTQEEHDNTCGTHTPTATPTATPTDPPANFRVTSVGINSVTLQWGALRSHRGITSARVSVYQQPEGSEFGSYQYIGQYSADRSGGSLRVSNLKSDTLYQFYLLYSTRSGLGMGGMLLVRTQIDPTQPTPTPTPTPLPKPTDAPVNFSVYAVGTNSISLQWGAAPRNRGITSGSIVEYEHNGSEYRYTGRHFSVGIPDTGRVRILGTSGLKSDTLYQFTLRFLDVDGDIVMSRSVTARTLADATQPTPTPTSTLSAAQATPTPTPTPTPTDEPVNFRVSGVGHDSISLQWEAAPRNRGIISGEIKAYEYMEAQSRYQYIRGDRAGLSAGNLLVSPLKSDTLYKFILTYRNSDYDVVMRPAVTVRTQFRFTPTATSTPLATPTPLPTLINDPTANFRASGVGHDSVALQWEAAPRNRGITSAYISAYERTDSEDSFIGRAGREYRYLGEHSVNISAGELLISGLKSDRVHKFYLLYRTRTGLITGGLILIRTQSPPTPTPTPTPVASSLTAPRLSARYAGANAIDLSWTPVTGADRYVLWRQEVADPGWQQIDDGNLRGTSYTDSGLTPGVTYQYAVRAIDGDGQPLGPWSNYPTATVPTASGSPLPTATLTPTPTATTAPDGAVGRVDDLEEPTPTPTPTPVASPLTAPALTAAAGEGAVELSWASVPGAARYELKVWWYPLPDWEPIGGTDGTSYTHSGLMAGRKYYYTIRTVNAGGEKSDWQQAFASATVPTASGSPLPTATLTPTPTATTAPDGAVGRVDDLEEPTPTATPTPVASPLTAPVLTAAAGENAVELSWASVPGAARYELKVWWYPLPDWEPIGGTDGTSYTHSGLTAGRKYYYTIRAVNAAGETSDWLQEPFPTATIAE